MSQLQPNDRPLNPTGVSRKYGLLSLFHYVVPVGICQCKNTEALNDLQVLSLIQLFLAKLLRSQLVKMGWNLVWKREIIEQVKSAAAFLLSPCLLRVLGEVAYSFASSNRMASPDGPIPFPVCQTFELLYWAVNPSASNKPEVAQSYLWLGRAQNMEQELAYFFGIWKEANNCLEWPSHQR